MSSNRIVLYEQSDNLLEIGALEPLTDNTTGLTIDFSVWDDYSSAGDMLYAYTVQALEPATQTLYTVIEGPLAGDQQDPQQGGTIEHG